MIYAFDSVERMRSTYGFDSQKRTGLKESSDVYFTQVDMIL